MSMQPSGLTLLGWANAQCIMHILCCNFMIFTELTLL